MADSEIRTFKKIFHRSCRIKNPTNQSGKPFLLDVPVNQNHFVRKRHTQDWTFRNYVEWKSAVCSFFCTLTFSEENLPRMKDGRPCFCPELAVKFIKRLRMYLKRKFNIDYGSMQYLLVSEYGKTTHRPHHHVMFHFKVFVAAPCFHKAVQDCWQLGFVDVEVPDSNRVLSYVSKYICKDVYAFDGNVDLSKDDDSVKEVRELYNFCTGKFDKSTYTIYNFHRQSLGFGRSWDNNITLQQWYDGVVFLPLDGQNPIPFAIPKYYADRVLRFQTYTVDDNGKRHYETHNTELGNSVSAYRKEVAVNNILQEITTFQRNQDNLLDSFGIDFTFVDLSIEEAYNHNDERYRLSKNPFEDFRKYFIERRHFKCPSYMQRSFVDESEPLLWNYYYYGYERLLSIYSDIKFEIDKHKQRSDEHDEFKKLRERQRQCRSY